MPHTQSSKREKSPKSSTIFLKDEMFLEYVRLFVSEKFLQTFLLFKTNCVNLQPQKKNDRGVAQLVQSAAVTLQRSSVRARSSLRNEEVSIRSLPRLLLDRVVTRNTVFLIIILIRLIKTKSMFFSVCIHAIYGIFN